MTAVRRANYPFSKYEPNSLQGVDCFQKHCLYHINRSIKELMQVKYVYKQTQNNSTNKLTHKTRKLRKHGMKQSNARNTQTTQTPHEQNTNRGNTLVN